MFERFRRIRSVGLFTLAAILAVTGTATADVIWERPTDWPPSDPDWMVAGNFSHAFLLIIIPPIEPG